MNITTKRVFVVCIFVITLLAIDQCVKIWVKTNMCLHASIRVTAWFYISFLENNGMAYGMTIIPKFALSAFRLVACCALVYFIGRQIREGARTIWVALLSLILAGALGNLIDCMFYGMIFAGSSPLYTSFPVDFGTGYAPFMQGKVVDMFYFPLIVTT